jgi:hypothetical protein
VLGSYVDPGYRAKEGLPGATWDALKEFYGPDAYEKAQVWRKEHEPKNYVVFDENAITIEKPGMDNVLG